MLAGAHFPPMKSVMTFFFEIIPITAQNTIMRYVQVWSGSTTKYLFEDRVIFISNDPFEDRILRTARRSNTEV